MPLDADRTIGFRTVGWGGGRVFAVAISSRDVRALDRFRALCCIGPPPPAFLACFRLSFFAQLWTLAFGLGAGYFLALVLEGEAEAERREPTRKGSGTLGSP